MLVASSSVDVSEVEEIKKNPVKRRGGGKHVGAIVIRKKKNKNKEIISM